MTEEVNDSIRNCASLYESAKDGCWNNVTIQRSIRRKRLRLRLYERTGCWWAIVEILYTCLWPKHSNREKGRLSSSLWLFITYRQLGRVELTSITQTHKYWTLVGDYFQLEINIHFVPSWEYRDVCGTVCQLVPCFLFKFSSCKTIIT